MLFNTKYIQNQFGYFYQSGYWCPEIVFYRDDFDYEIPGNEEDNKSTLDDESESSNVKNMNEESSSSSQSDNDDDERNDIYTELENVYYKTFSGDATSIPVSQLDTSLVVSKSETSDVVHDISKVNKPTIAGDVNVELIKQNKNSSVDNNMTRCNDSFKLKPSVAKNITTHYDDPYGSKIEDFLRSDNSDSESDCNVNITSVTKIDCNKAVFLKRTRTIF